MEKKKELPLRLLTKIKNNMKELKTLGLFLLVMLMGVAVSSCGGSDDDEPFDISKAYGTWMCVTSKDTDRGYTADGLLVGKEVTVKKDGTFTSTGSTIGETGQWTNKDNQVTAKSSVGTFVLTMSFSGDKMIWNGTASNGVSFYYVFQKE